MAGSETTAKALSFCFLYMVLYPEVQKKAQKEIDAVLGRDRFPTLNDRPRYLFIKLILMFTNEVSKLNPKLCLFQHAVCECDSFRIAQDVHGEDNEHSSSSYERYNASWISYP